MLSKVFWVDGFSALKAAVTVFLMILPVSELAKLPSLAKRDNRELGTGFSVYLFDIVNILSSEHAIFKGTVGYFASFIVEIQFFMG
jgi:hypothetical protein